MAAEKKRRGLPADLALLALALLVATGILRLGLGQYYKAAYPIDYRELVERESGANALPTSLVYAVIRTESGFNPAAQSSVQARGLMQITKPTFEWAQLRLQEQRQLHFDDLYQSEVNIRYGSAILRLLLDEFGTVENALCAYHAGWGTAKKWLADPQYAPDGKHITAIPYGDTKRYVDKVLSTQATYEALYNNEQ